MQIKNVFRNIKKSIVIDYSKFLRQSLFIVKSYLLGLVVFFISRVTFILRFGNYQELSVLKSDLIHSFVTGIRFDTIVLAYLFLILLIISIINIFKTTHINLKQTKITDKFFVIYTTVIITLIIIVCFTDFYYYKFFSSHINIAAFGIFEDETKSLLASIWTDYPIIKIGLFLISIAFLLYKAIKFIYYKKSNFNIKSIGYRFLYLTLFITVYGLGMRCSFGNVPLEYMEASISSNTFINNIPINGVFALKNAFEERKNGIVDISVETFLKKYDYSSMEDIIKDYSKYFLKKKQEQYPDLSLDSLIIDKTSTNSKLEKKPINIVFIQMESMSSYYLQLHSKEFNMLGQLEHQLKNVTVFTNFFPCRNFTIFTIDGLLIHSPLSPISQSKYMNISFPLSAIKPFIDKGYDTEFITGGRINWRNLDQFLPRQGFNLLEGGADIKKHCPNAIEEHEWGVYDEFLFERILQRIKQKRENPVFIYGMTITNHTPYKIPANYKPYSLELTPEIKSLIKSYDEKTRNSFLCYQYMCDCLGNFIKSVTNSEYADNTLIIATGDHSSHVADNIFGFSDKDAMKCYSVPLIIYIPDKLKSNLFIDTHRFGSHNDIFPTIYNLCLSDAKYYKSGNNLFSNDSSTQFIGIHEYTYAVNDFGLVKYKNQKFTYYNWLDSIGGDVITIENQSSRLQELGNTLRAYSAFNTLNTIKQLSDKRNIINNINK